MAQQFRYLFTPMKLGPVTVRNRIAFPAHGTGMIHGNVLSEQNMDYFAERARGGVGLIIREPENVHPTSRHRGTGWFVDGTDKVVLEHKKLAGAVHQHGAKIAVQLVHGGQNALSFLTERELWAPSPVGAATRRQWPKEMEVEDIREVVAAFARSARNAKAGEMDGCEIHAGHGYLLHEFITPYYNKRTDQYGGSLDNRLRVVYEVIDAIRKECGDDFMVGIRLSGDELVAGGLTPKDYQEVVRKLEDHGGLDYFHMSIGLAQTATYITPPMDVPPGYNVYTAAAVREVVRDTPVICVGRINDVLLAEKVLAEGHADMVGMVRALIADPELPNKAREGKEDDICHCVACLQGCHERVGVDVWLTCLTNPAAGREKELGIGTMKPAITKKKVMVVGSGPAGLEAARVAALRGHEVSLYEKSPELGGKVSIASKAPSRDEFMEIVRWRGQQLKKLGVKIHLNTEVTLQMVEQVKPDAVVVATGSSYLRTGFSPDRPNIPEIPGANQPNVVTVEDVLQDKVDVGNKVVLVDNETDQAGVGTAEFLVERGKQVEIVTRHPSIGLDVPARRLSFALKRLFTHGAVVHNYHALKEIKGRTVSITNNYSQKETAIQDVDTVVLHTARKADNELYTALKGRVKELYAVGDCLAPRTALDAILDGHRLGRRL